MKDPEKSRFSSLILSKGSVRGELGVIKAIAICRIKVFFRYPLNTLWFLLLPFGFMSALYAFSGLINYNIFHEGVGGDIPMTSYIFMGLAVLYLSNIGYNGAMGLKQEQMIGLMEPTLATPIPRFSYVLGLIIGETATSGIFSLIMAAIGITTLGMAHLSSTRIILSLVVLVLSAASFFGVGLVLSSLVLRYKQLGGLQSIFAFFLQFTSGIFVPVRSLPFPLAHISYIIPLTWQIDAFRSLLLGTTPLIPIELEFILITSFALSTVLAGSILFKRAEKRIKEMGTVSLY